MHCTVLQDAKMSEEQIAELKQVSSYCKVSTLLYCILCWQAFNEFDVDGGGTINTRELGTAHPAVWLLTAWMQDTPCAPWG